jgi:hypothetical protein
MTHYRTLFLNDSEASREAEISLKQKGISFAKAKINGDSKEFCSSELPVLITDEGEWRGLQAVLRYANQTI